MTHPTEEPFICPTSDAIHEWFGLSYASWLVLPRVLLQSMPVEWQRRFVEMLREYEEAFPLDYIERPDEYWVRTKVGNRFVENPLPHYRHGYVQPKTSVKAPEPSV